jgi:hypothetical protein
MPNRFEQTTITTAKEAAHSLFETEWKTLEIVTFPLVPVDENDLSGEYEEDKSAPTRTPAEYTDAIANIANTVINAVMDKMFEELNIAFPVSE